MGTKKLFLNNRIILSQLFMAVLGLIILFTGSYWDGKNILGDILFFTGALLVGIATVGRLWCSMYISGYKNDQLITKGPYSLCRNPLYFFSLLGAAGVGLATETLLIPGIIVAVFAIYYPFIIRREEGRLIRHYKDSFSQYCKKIPRFIPSFASFEEPEEYTVRPKFLRARFIDSLWFVWMIGILELVEALHSYSVIPLYLKLY